MTETTSIANLPPWTPTSDDILVFTDRADGITKRTDINNLPSSGGDALTTNPLSQFASTTSAQLAGVISDETWSGWVLVFSNSPALTTPSISAINVSGGTLTLPTGASDTLVRRNATETLTGKTLTAPIISTISNTGTLTLPTSTDTLVGRATTDTLINKTLTSPKINVWSDATGDIYYRNSWWNIARLPIGTSWQILNVNTWVPAWTTIASSQEWTLIETLTPSAVTSFNSSTFTAYDKLRIEVNITTSSSSTELAYTVNSDTSWIYFYSYFNSTTFTQLWFVNNIRVWISASNSWSNIFWDIYMNWKWNKSISANISAYEWQRIFDWYINTWTNITSIQFTRPSWSWTFTWTVKIYWKNY